MHQIDQNKDIIFTFATVSLVCSVLMLLTYHIQGTWKFENKGTKRMLYTMSIFTALHSFALCFLQSNKPDWECKTQACFIQFFGIGSILLQSSLSIESYCCLQSMMNTTADFSQDEMEKQSKGRFRIIALSVCGFNLTGVLTIIFGNYQSDRGVVPFICYLENVYIIVLYGLLPLLFTCGIILVCNTVILYRLLSLYDYSTIDHNITTTTTSVTIKKIHTILDAYNRLTPRAKLSLHRMLILPILYLAITVIIIVYNTHYYESSNTLPGVIASLGTYVLLYIYILHVYVYILHGIAAVSGGIVNFVVWILLDRDVLFSK